MLTSTNLTPWKHSLARRLISPLCHISCPLKCVRILKHADCIVNIKDRRGYQEVCTDCEAYGWKVPWGCSEDSYRVLHDICESKEALIFQSANFTISSTNPDSISDIFPHQGFCLHVRTKRCPRAGKSLFAFLIFFPILEQHDYEDTDMSDTSELRHSLHTSSLLPCTSLLPCQYKSYLFTLGKRTWGVVPPNGPPGGDNLHPLPCILLCLSKGTSRVGWYLGW